MDVPQMLVVVFFIAVAAAVARACMWVYGGGFYYRRYPCAKLIDDMAKAGKTSTAMYDVIQRVGGADDQRAEIAQIRREIGLN